MMDAQFGWDIVIPIYFVYGLGVGVLLWMWFKVWEKVIHHIIKRFKFDREFIDFVKHKYQGRKSK